MKLSTWISSVHSGKRADVLALFLLCKITETQCFVHCTCNSYWSTLKEEPISHEDYLQKTNLHLGYIGRSMYIQLELHTVNTQFEIFGVDTPIEVKAVDTKPLVVGSLTSDEEEMLNELMNQGLDNLPTPMMSKTQNRQASASYGSQHEMESANIKQEQHQSSSSLRPPRIEPRPPKVEPLLSIKKLMTKDIEREQQRLKVKAPTLPKPKPKYKEPSMLKSVETTKCTGSFKVLTHSLIKRKRHYYYKCKVGECKVSFNRIKSWNIHHLVKHNSVK